MNTGRLNAFRRHCRVTLSHIDTVAILVILGLLITDRISGILASSILAVLLVFSITRFHRKARRFKRGA